MKNYSSEDYTGVTIQGGVFQAPILNSPNILTPTIDSPTITAPTITGNTNGPIRTPTLIISDIIAEKAWPFIFTANTPNQKIDLSCANATYMESLLDITVTTHIGTISRRFSLQKQGGGVTQLGARYNEVIGNVTPYMAISDALWDATNQHWRFKIVNRTPYTTTFEGTVSIRVITSTTTAPEVISAFALGSVYTTDTTLYPEPIYQFSGSIQADSIITNFIKKGVNYTILPTDSVILLTAGVTVTLPVNSSVAVGRSFVVKNTQNSGVTLIGQGIAKIDNATSVTVGNGVTYTVMNDGVHWWIVSAYK